MTVKRSQLFDVLPRSLINHDVAITRNGAVLRRAVGRVESTADRTAGLGHQKSHLCVPSLGTSELVWVLRDYGSTDMSESIKSWSASMSYDKVEEVTLARDAYRDSLLMSLGYVEHGVMELFLLGLCKCACCELSQDSQLLLFDFFTIWNSGRDDSHQIFLIRQTQIRWKRSKTRSSKIRRYK